MNTTLEHVERMMDGYPSDGERITRDDRETIEWFMDRVQVLLDSEFEDMPSAQSRLAYQAMKAAVYTTIARDMAIAA